MLRRDLESDSYESFNLELIGMLATKAEKLVPIIHRDGAVTPKTRRAIRDIRYMVDEALLMAKVSPTVATRGRRFLEITDEEFAKINPDEIVYADEAKS